MNEPKKILIIDDEPNMCWALDCLLKGAGFSVFKALTGHGALSSIETEHFCCVLLDAKLPDMEGLLVLEQLREDEWGKNARVIILTNLSDSERVSAAVEKGVSDFRQAERLGGQIDRSRFGCGGGRYCVE